MGTLLKQRIDQSQMDSLTVQQKKKLADWADPKDDLDWPWSSDGVIRKGKLPLLTIGQMIQFLHEHSDEGGYFYEHLTEKYGPYDGGFLVYDLRRWRVSSTYESEELANALWLAVVDVLKEEEKSA